MDERAIGTSIAPTGEDSDDELAKEWRSLDWHSIERQVSRTQTKISKAVMAGNHNDAKRFSYLLTHSFSAKALAVRKVCLNKGADTPGVDGVLWLNDTERMRVVKSLDPNHYRAKPLRRVEIPKKNGKKRPLGIPTMHDRAMQTLYQFALDPICEATSDPNSYGFRVGRSAKDACEQAFTVLAKKSSSEWVLEGDIKGCFDHISHEWLIENIPMDKRTLKQFLKAGYIFDRSLFPTEEGTPQGGAISPTLANMTLNGMEPLLKEHFGKNSKVNMVRYADDFIVTAPSKEVAIEVRQLLIPFLAERGLELSTEKTLVTHIDDGFDFLGFNFRKYDGKLLITPSEKSFEGIKDRIREVVLGAGKAWSQEKIIKTLNPILRGWCEYFRNVCSKRTFSNLHNYIFHILKRWGHRRHTRKSYRWIYDRYWHTTGRNNWVFSEGSLRLFSPKSVPVRRHIKVKGGANPYIDREYFLKRKKGTTAWHRSGFRHQRRPQGGLMVARAVCGKTRTYGSKKGANP